MDKIKVRSESAGRFRIEALQLDESGQEIEGTRRVAADWFDNLITAGGLNRMGGNTDYLAWCQAGAGTTPPAPTDTALGSRIAATNTRAATAAGSQSSAPFYTWRRNTYRFAQGAAAGNISEVAVGWGSTGDIFSRALIRDANGDPTTITVLANETLDVTYELRHYPSTADFTGEVTLTGNIGGTYNWTLRPANVTSNNNASTGWFITETGLDQGYYNTLNGDTRTAFSGPIGAMTAQPSGSPYAGLPVTVAPYQANSLERRWTIALAINDANFPAPGLRSFLFRLGLGTYQIEFNPPIPKTGDDVLSLTFFHSWGRKA